MSLQFTDVFDPCSTPDVVSDTATKAGTANAPLTLSVWLEMLPVPAWITSVAGQALSLNEKARALVGKAGVPPDQQPCQRALQRLNKQYLDKQLLDKQCPANECLDKSNFPICEGGCCVMEDRGQTPKSEGVAMQILTATGAPRWFRVFVSIYRGKDSQEPSLVHLAFDIDKERRLESYFERIVNRAGQNAGSNHCRVRLTRREREILDLLADDETLWAIADKLCLSYCTVRNHVQHILTKLGAHSIIEAVAHYLTMPDAFVP